MMRGSVVFLAVFAVSSYSIGVNGAFLVKSGTRGYGNGRGNEDAPGIGESASGNGGSDGRGHYIGKRSLLGLNLVRNLGHDIARLAAVKSAAALRQQIPDPNAQFPIPIQPPQFGGAIPPGVTPLVLNKPWNYPPLVNRYDLPLKRAMPSVSEGEVRPLPTLRFLPLSEMKDKAMKIISKIVTASRNLAGTIPKPLVRSSYARSQNFYRSDLTNGGSRYSGLRSYSPLRTYQTLPGPSVNDIVIPLSKHVRNAAQAQPGTDVNFRADMRSFVVEYLLQLWDKISKWINHGSDSGIGMGDSPPKGVVPEGDIFTGEGKAFVASLPPEDGAHKKPPHDEESDYDDVIIEHAPPLTDDGVPIIHLSPEEDAFGTAEIPEGLLDAISGEDSTGEGESHVDEDYFRPVQPKPGRYKPNQDAYWEARYSRRMEDGLGDVNEDHFKPIRSKPVNYNSMLYSNWEARRAEGMEDAASTIEDISEAIRRKNLRDDLETITNIFGRLADD